MDALSLGMCLSHMVNQTRTENHFAAGTNRLGSREASLTKSSTSIATPYPERTLERSYSVHAGVGSLAVI